MEYYTTIGADVSDRTSKICVMTKTGGKPTVVGETTIPTTPDGFRGFLKTQDPSSPLVFETGTHCRWIKDVAEEAGFKVFVANPCRLRLITESKTKNDRNDAKALARLALADVELLSPVKLRDGEHQTMVNLHQMRDGLVRDRTGAVLQIRNFAKSMGFRIPDCQAESFHNLDRRAWPKALNDLVWPLIKHLKSISVTIKTVEKQMRRLAKTPAFREQVERLMQIDGVGFFTATCFVAVTGGDVDRFDSPRDVGPWLGLTQRQDQSGDTDRQCRITHAGSGALRWKLTECANLIMRDSAPDTDLKVKGMRICARGGKTARKKARVAVARRLAVLMVAMLKNPKPEYRRISDSHARELQAMRAAKAAV